KTAKSLALGPGDIAKQINLSWYWDLPVGRGKHFLSNTSGPLDYLLGNWRFSALQYYQSGDPIAVTTNSGFWPILNPGVPIKAVGGCGDVQPNIAGKSTYLNRAAFQNPPPFSLGNVFVLPTVRGCGYIDEDLGVDKGIAWSKYSHEDVVCHDGRFA